MQPINQSQFRITVHCAFWTGEGVLKRGDGNIFS